LRMHLDACTGPFLHVGNPADGGKVTTGSEFGVELGNPPSLYPGGGRGGLTLGKALATAVVDEVLRALVLHVEASEGRGRRGECGAGRGGGRGEGKGRGRNSGGGGRDLDQGHTELCDCRGWKLLSKG